MVSCDRISRTILNRTDRDLGNPERLRIQGPSRQACMMKLRRRAARVPHALPSERGFLEMAGREQGLSLRDAFIRFRDLVSADMDWADSRKVRNRQRAWRTKLSVLVLTAASTVVLGIPAIPESVDDH